MPEREYFVSLPENCSLRVRYVKRRGHILQFTVQLEFWTGEDWRPITRYDNAHGFIHRDDLRPDGTQQKTPPMAFESNEQALNYALRDLRKNYRFYLERYWRWKQNRP